MPKCRNTGTHTSGSDPVLTDAGLANAPPIASRNRLRSGVNSFANPKA
jgi:hypothetical protein